jgi:hypothetical protein
MRIHLFLFVLIQLFLTSALAQGLCSDLFSTTLKSARESTYFHNKEVRELFKNGVNSKTLENATKVFVQEGVLDIPVTEKGFVAAANVGDHHGGYGRFLWFRDFARVQMGLSALPKVIDNAAPAVALVKGMEAQKVRDAQLVLLSDAKWTELAIKNIENSEVHLDGANGFRSVIWIRRLLDPFLENRPATKEEVELESRWGHKQNDALAVFANSFLDVLQKNQIHAEQLTEPARLNIMLLAAYFVRLQYWKVWDVGAWEENMGQRSSSIAMVTSFLERFQEGMNKDYSAVKDKTQEDILFEQLQSSLQLILQKNMSPETVHLTQDALRFDNLQLAINEAYVVLRERLLNSKGPLIEAKNDNPYETRLEDTALIHMFWHPLKNISPLEQGQILQKLSNLERGSGYVRYLNDWFLYGSAQAAQHASALAHFGDLAVPNGTGGYRKASQEDINNILSAYSTKDMDRVISISGKNLEAQWTMPDSYLVQIYANEYIKTKNPEFLEKAKIHLLRASGLITGKGEFNSEGHAVEAWRLPEAYVPVTFIKDGKVEVVHLASPNSPLNWSIAEFILALDTMKTALALADGQ